jgi:hypothetical protein
MRSVTRFVVAAAMAAFFTNAQAIQQGACKADAQKLCKDVQPGEGKLLECLQQHQTEVSAPCKGNLKEVGQAMKQMSNACEPDIEKFCWNTPIGKGGIASCLKQHSADLSTDCQTAVAKAKTKK